MGLGERLKFKYLQASYRPRKPKPVLGFAKGFFNDVEDFLTPDSEKKKSAEKDGKDDK